MTRNERRNDKKRFSQRFPGLCSADEAFIRSEINGRRSRRIVLQESSRFVHGNQLQRMRKSRFHAVKKMTLESFMESL